MNRRYLFSHMPFNDAWAFANQHPEQPPLDEQAFRAWWDASQIALTARPAAWEAPVVQDLPAGNEAYVAQVSAIPLAALMGNLTWTIRVVDLRTVVSFQMYVSEERIVVPDGLATAEMAGLLSFCVRMPAPMMLAVQQGPGEETTVSLADLNLRVVGKVAGETPQGPFFGFTVSGGLPWMQVARVNDRLYLRDGYHRAIGLLRANITHVPVVVIDPAQQSDIGLAPGFLPADRVLGPQPPMLADFLDDGLSRNVLGIDQIKVVRITAEQFAVPTITPTVAPVAIAPVADAAVTPPPPDVPEVPAS